jgi:hypothetical protein
LAAADDDWSMTVTQVPSQTSPDGIVLRIEVLQARNH